MVLKLQLKRLIFSDTILGIAIAFGLNLLGTATVDAQSNRFRILSPSGPNAQLYSNSPARITWAGGNPQGVVTIRLSTNGGVSYGYTLASNVPVSAGSRTVLIPNLITQNAIIMLRTNLAGVNDTNRISISEPVAVSRTIGGCFHCVPSGTNESTYQISSISISETGSTSSMTHRTESSIAKSTFIDNYRTMSTAWSLKPGKSYNFKIDITGSGSKSMGIWLDRNKDCSFQTTSNELLFSGTTTGSSITGTFVTGTFGTTGEVKLRIRIFGTTRVLSNGLTLLPALSSLTLSQSCITSIPITTGGSTSISQTQDFKVTLLGTGARINVAEDLESGTEKNEIRIFPNPNKEGNPTTVLFGNSDSGPVRISIFNTTGKEVFVKESAPFENTISIDSGLGTGIYLVRITREDHLETRRLIIQ